MEWCDKNVFDVLYQIEFLIKNGDRDLVLICIFMTIFLVWLYARGIFSNKHSKAFAALSPLMREYTALVLFEFLLVFLTFWLSNVQQVRAHQQNCLHMTICLIIVVEAMFYFRVFSLGWRGWQKWLPGLTFIIIIIVAVFSNSFWFLFKITKEFLTKQPVFILLPVFLCLTIILQKWYCVTTTDYTVLLNSLQDNTIKVKVTNQGRTLRRLGLHLPLTPPRHFSRYCRLIEISLCLFTLFTDAVTLLEYFLIANYMVHFNEGKYSNISNMFRSKAQRVAIILFMCMRPLLSSQPNVEKLVLRSMIFLLETDRKSGAWQHMACVVCYTVHRLINVQSFDVAVTFFAAMFTYFDSQCKTVYNNFMGLSGCTD